MISEKLQRRIVLSASVILPLILYAMTSCRGIYAGDCSELALAAARLQIAHPPGYPLLTNLGYLWTQVNFFLRPVIALNLFSTVAMAAAVGSLYCLLELLLLPTLLRQRLVLLAATQIFAASLAIWSSATSFEVYPLAALLFTITLFFVIRSQASAEIRYFLLSLFLFGVCLCNHLSAIALAPAAAVLIHNQRHWITTKRLLMSLMIFAVPLTMYIYLPIRSQFRLELDWFDPSSWAGLRELLFAEEYRRFVASPVLTDVPIYLSQVSSLIWRQHLIPILLLAIPGIGIQWRRNRTLILILATILVTNIALNFFYLIPDIEPYFIPTLLILSIWLAETLYFFATVRFSRLTVSAIILACALLVASNFSDCDVTQRTEWEDYGRRLLSEVPANGVLICGSDLTQFPVLYLRYVEGVRADCEVYGYRATFSRLKADWRLSDSLEFADRALLLQTLASSVDRPLVLSREIAYSANDPGLSLPNVTTTDLIYCLDSCGEVSRIVPPVPDVLPKSDDPRIAAVYLTELLIKADALDVSAQGEKQELLKKAEKIAEQFPSSFIPNSLANHLVIAGDYSAAYRVLKNMFTNAKFRLHERQRRLPLWASVNLEMGDRLVAKAAYTEILQFNDRDNTAKFSLLMIDGDDATARGELLAGIGFYEQAASMMPRIYETKFRLGSLYLKVGRIPEAQAVLEECIRNNYRAEEASRLLDSAASQ